MWELAAVVVLIVILVLVYWFLIRKKSGTCTVDSPDPNSNVYSYDSDGKCVLTSCNGGYHVVDDTCVQDGPGPGPGPGPSPPGPSKHSYSLISGIFRDGSSTPSTAQSQTECQTACDNSDTCLGYGWGNGTCSLVTEIGSQLSWVDKSNPMTNNITLLKDFKGPKWFVVVNAGVSGTRLSYTTEDHDVCFTKCEQNENCNSLTYVNMEQDIGSCDLRAGKNVGYSDQYSSSILLR